MRGAVLYKTGLDMVRERVMRRNYGMIVSVLFEEGDPIDLRFIGKDGRHRCKDVLSWFVHKVFPFWENELIFRAPKYRISLWLNIRSVLTFILTSICAKDLCVSQYNFFLLITLMLQFISVVISVALLPFDFWIIIALIPICTISVDLRKLPKEAFQRQDCETRFWEVKFDIAVVFGQMMEFKLLYKGKVMQRAVGQYLWSKDFIAG
jgi:hypothetical protein